MKRILVLTALLSGICSIAPAQQTHIDSLLRAAETSGKAADCHQVALYYEEHVDTARLRMFAQKTYALALNERDTDEQGNALLRMSTYYEYMGDFTLAMQKAQQALALFRIQGDAELMGNAMNFIAYYYNETGQHHRAIDIYRQLIAHCMQSEHPDRHYNMAMCHSNMSHAYINLGVPDSAIVYNRKALDIAEAISDTSLIIGAASQLATIHSKKHHYTEALKYYGRALELAQQTNHTIRAIYLYTNIAMVYAEWGKKEQALELVEKALQLASTYGEQVTYARVLAMYGTVLVISERYHEAITKALQSLLFVQNTPFHHVHNLETLVTGYCELGRMDSSTFYLSKLEAYIDTVPSASISRIHALKGTVLFRQKKYREAIPLMEKAAELRVTVDRHTQKESVKLYGFLSEAWLKGFRNYERALYYKQMETALADSIYRKEHSEAMADFDVKYQTAEKELEISRLRLQEEQLLRARARIATGLAVLAALLLVAWLYALFLRWKKKAEIAEWGRRMEAKDAAYRASVAETEQKRLQSYLEGLESERSRLARELHDHVSNGLLAIGIKMQTAEVPDELTAMICHLHTQVRDISHALIPPVFQYASLPEIIDDYIREQNRLDGPCFQFYLVPEEGWETLPHRMALDLYRIVQEACTNAIKHACARNTTISLSRNEQQMELSIVDDGCGFQLADAVRGIGLQTIRERTANLNGTVSIRSSPDKGTEIRILLLRE